MNGLTRFFEDLVIGEVLLSGTRTLTAEDITTFARQYDPQWFHADADAARESVWGEVVASGIQTMAAWRTTSPGSAAWAGTKCVGRAAYALGYRCRPAAPC